MALGRAVRTLSSVAQPISAQWQTVLGGLSPAHCASMSREQLLAVANLLRLSPAFRPAVPLRVFVSLAAAAVGGEGGIRAWPADAAASLLVALRAGELHALPEARASVQAVEADVLSRDLSTLSLAAVTAVFSSFAGTAAAATPALGQLAAELGRRADSLTPDVAGLGGGVMREAARLGEPATAVVMDAPAFDAPVARRVGVATVVEQLLPPLQRLESIDEIVAAVEEAVTAVLASSAREGSGSSRTAAQLVRHNEAAVDRIQAAAIAQLLRQYGDGGSAEGGSGGSAGGQQGRGSGYRRNDWRRRATDGVVLAAGVGAALAVGTVLSGLQAAQVSTPPHRLVTALQAASPAAALRILGYVLGPVPTTQDGTELGGLGARGPGGAVESAAAVTVVAAARRALARGGVDRFTPPQLCALVELMGGAETEGLSAARASPFWLAVLASVSSRPPGVFSLDQRISIAHRFVIVARAAGQKHGQDQRAFNDAAGALLGTLVDASEGGGTAALSEALIARPAIIPTLAFISGAAKASKEELAEAIALALASLSAREPSTLTGMTAHALWSLLLLFEKTGVGMAAPGPRLAGGSMDDVVSALMSKPADETMRTAPLLITSLLVMRTHAHERAGPTMWDRVPAAYVDDLWAALLPSVHAAAANGFVPVRAAQGGSGRAGHAAAGEQPQAAPAAPAALARALVNRKFALLDAAAGQAGELPSARAAALALTDGLYRQEAARAEGHGRGERTSPVYDFINLTRASAALGHAQQAGADAAAASECGLAFGRSLTLVSRGLGALRFGPMPLEHVAQIWTQLLELDAQLTGAKGGLGLPWPPHAVAGLRRSLSSACAACAASADASLERGGPSVNPLTRVRLLRGVRASTALLPSAGRALDGHDPHADDAGSAAALLGGAADAAAELASAELLTSCARIASALTDGAPHPSRVPLDARAPPADVAGAGARLSLGGGDRRLTLGSGATL